MIDTFALLNTSMVQNTFGQVLFKLMQLKWSLDVVGVKTGEPNGLYIGQLWIKVIVFGDLFFFCYFIVVAIETLLCTTHSEAGWHGEWTNALRMRMNFLHFRFSFFWYCHVETSKIIVLQKLSTLIWMQTDFSGCVNM